MNAGHSDLPIFQRFSQNLQRFFAKFRQFIQEQYAMMGQRDLAGTWNRTASDHRRHRTRMMRTPIRPLGH